VVCTFIKNFLRKTQNEGVLKKMVVLKYLTVALSAVLLVFAVLLTLFLGGTFQVNNGAGKSS